MTQSDARKARLSVKEADDGQPGERTRQRRSNVGHCAAAEPWWAGAEGNAETGTDRWGERQKGERRGAPVSGPVLSGDASLELTLARQM